MRRNLKKILTVTLLFAMVLTTLPFAVSAVNGYWGYDDYNTIENKGAPEEITSYSTKVTRKPTASAWGYISEYLFQCTTDAGTLYYTLQETSWSTYNLGMMYLVDSNGKKHQFVEGYTDWEYVYRVNDKNGATVWSGGNHGNEILVSLELYNGETGEKISLSDNKSETANVIHIIQKTKLLNMPDLDNSSVVTEIDGWTEDDVYAEVTRKYTITGPQIKLNVDYKYVKDATHYQSYTCMFPISKTYGLYCDMYDKDGDFIKSIITPETNSNYSGSHNSGNYATRALIYGKNYSQYQFDVRVNTYVDSLEGQINDYKTAFWDMSSSNKLYFTKYPLGEYTAPVISAGTEYHTECIWLFRYEPEGRTPTEVVPVSLNKNYTITNTNDAVTSPEYNVYYGALLTDGVASSVFNASDNSWFALWWGTHTSGSVSSVTVDLEDTYDLTSISLNLANQAGFGVTAPTKIEAFVKNGDSDFVSVGTFELNSGADAIYETSMDIDVSATQVRIDFTLDGNSPCAYINEISVYGTEKPLVLDEDSEPMDNLIRGLEYDISVTNEPVSDSQWGTSYKADLTDGIAATTFSATDDSWFIYSAYKNLENGIGTFTVDLGKVCDISKLRLHLANVGQNMGVYAPAKITAYALVDGEYVSVGDFGLDTSDTVIYWTALEVENIQTSSIKIEFTVSGSFAYVNEIEVHGTEVETAEPEYLKGDVNNDGKLNGTDYLMMKRIVMGILDYQNLDAPETAFDRCDYNGDGRHAAVDYFMLKRAILS